MHLRVSVFADLSLVGEAQGAALRPDLTEAELPKAGRRLAWSDHRLGTRQCGPGGLPTEIRTALGAASPAAFSGKHGHKRRTAPLPAQFPHFRVTLS
jgi:hypothetical protein